MSQIQAHRSRRALGKQRRRGRILDAARAIVATDGVDGLSMRKVARAAAVSVTTLYNLFGSKEELRRALCGDLLDGIDRELAATPLSRPIERAEAVIGVGAAHVVRFADVTRPAILAAAQAPQQPDPAAPRSTEMQRVALQAAMDVGLLRGDLRAEPLAAQIYQGFGQAALGWASGRLDANGFRDDALYALYVCLLAVASDALRPQLVASIERLEPRMAGRDPRAA